MAAGGARHRGHESLSEGGHEQRCAGGEGSVGVYVEVAALQAGEQRVQGPRGGLRLYKEE